MATSHENSDGIVLVRDEKVVHSQDFNASFLFFYSRARFLLTDRRIVTERPKGLWEIITRGSEIESVPLAQISSVGMHRGTRGWAIIVWIIGLSMIIGGLFGFPGLESIVIGALIIMVFGFTGGIRVNTTGGQSIDVRVRVSQRNTARAFVQRINAALAEREGETWHPAAPSGQPAPQADVAAQLEKLAELNRSGALNDQEFEEAKAKLLDRL